MRDHLCLDRPRIFGRRTYISISLNLSPETTCLDRPNFCGQWRGQAFKTVITIAATAPSTTPKSPTVAHITLIDPNLAPTAATTGTTTPTTVTTTTATAWCC